MTLVKQTRILFEPTDIIQVRIVCTKCKGDIGHPLHRRSFQLPDKCPHCHEEWKDERFPMDRMAAETLKLLEAANYLSKATEADSSPFMVRFEIDGEDKPTSS